MEDLIKEIYWLIGRADPTADDLRGAAKQVAHLIELKRPDLAKTVRNERNWPDQSLFKTPNELP